MMNWRKIDISRLIGVLSSAARSSSCKRFMAYAALISVLFFSMHLLGFREYTGILSGTASPGSKYPQYFGTIYVLLYFSFVAIVPVLVIASVLVETAMFLMRLRIRKN